MKRALFLIIGLGTLCFGQVNRIAYFKYFQTEHDFIADNTLRIPARIGVAHLEVAYGENDQPVLVTNYSKLGLPRSYELHSYDNTKRLTRRAWLDSLKTVVRVIWYGEDEAWSEVFRDYAIDPTKHLSFQGQNSQFTFAASGRIGMVAFRTVDGFDYGRIRFKYDQQNRLIEEAWITLPDYQTVRKYVYQWVAEPVGLHLREYDRNQQLVSHVTLEQAPADQLYKVPPPRIGNILDEVDLVLEEISIHKTQLPYPALIPKSEWDRLVLKSGEELQIHYIGMSGSVVRFQQSGELDELALPLERVQVIISRYGERIYP